MYRKNQFTVYKQLTRFMKRMIYCTGWRPTVQSSWPSYGLYYQQQSMFDVSSQSFSSSSHHLWLNTFLKLSKHKFTKPTEKTDFSCKTKTSKESHDCTTHNNSISGPKRYIYSSWHDSSVGLVSWLCYSSDFELHHIFSLYCRLLTQAYEQQANGKKDQQVSMTFIQPSRFPKVFYVIINLFLLCEKQTNKKNLFKFSKLVSFLRILMTVHSCWCVIGSGDARNSGSVLVSMLLL